MAQEDIIKKIKALRAKATNKASTEAEMQAAALAITKLMMRHDIEEGDLVDRPQLDAVHVHTDPHKADLELVIETCWYGISKLTETKMWGEPVYDRKGRTKRYNYIGTPADVEMAMYLHEMIIMTARRCWWLYKAEAAEGGANRTSHTRKDYYTTFGHRIGQRLEELAEQRKSVRSDSTSLVVHKDAMIKAKMKSMDVVVRKSRRKGHRVVDPNAYGAALRDADKVNLGRPFAGSTKDRIE